jgi:fatty acid desaturase
MASGINLSDLNKRNDGLSVLTVSLHLGLVYIPVHLGAILDPGPLHIFLWICFGLTMNGLLNLMHECAHCLVFNARWGSDLLGRWIWRRWYSPISMDIASVIGHIIAI